MPSGVVPLMLYCLGCWHPWHSVTLHQPPLPDPDIPSPVASVGRCMRQPLPTFFDVVSWRHAAPEEIRSDEPISPDYLTGRFDPANDARFVQVPARYRTQNAPIYLRREALEAFRAMAEAAEADGVRLRIVSGARTFEQQRDRWTAVWQGQRPVNGGYLEPTLTPEQKASHLLRWIAMPATSRHHWGTDLDINSVEPRYFERAPGRDEHAWLARHAAGYGFCQPYAAKGIARPVGYEEEKWHWSYLPLARPLLAAYRQHVQHDHVHGFAGAETLAPLNVLDHHVQAIDTSCR